ncbi:MAG: hypothetical protein IJI14_12030 [Anaerolineaceae bacterium]|nr:hypothetical protein [Anaerolineaceae bacterium]
MEKYVVLFTELIKFFITHFDAFISILALIISFISLAVVLRDRKNHTRIELLSNRELVDRLKADPRVYPYMIPAFYVIVRNTGRTNIYIRNAWVTINGFDFNLTDPKTLPKHGVIGTSEIPGADPDRPVEPFTERLYRIYYAEIQKKRRIASSWELQIQAHVSLQSGKSSETKMRKFKSSEIFDEF